MEHHSLVVVGAGICGLLVARAARDAGLAPLVLEKSRGVGGRMATKRFGESSADTGAQFFTARDARFAALVAEWEERGWVRVWPGSEGGPGEARWIGVPGMTSVAKHLADGLEVRRDSKVRAVVRETHGWMLQLESGGVVRADRVVATAPVPQVLEWLEAGGALPECGDLAVLQEVRYEPCLTLCVQLAGGGAVPEPGWISFPPGGHAVLAWVSDNHVKGVSATPALTVQANGAWSAEHYAAPAEAVEAALIEAARPWIGRALVKERVLHRWKFSRVVRAASKPFWTDVSGNFIVAGDAFGGARVEGAALSALEVTRYLHPASGL
jgi:predicted NAD/FAD-dependent oxidoreductase